MTKKTNNPADSETPTPASTRPTDSQSGANSSPTLIGRRNLRKHTGFLSNLQLKGLNQSLARLLQEPRSPEETGIPTDFLLGLVLKTLYLNGSMTALKIAEYLRLNFSGVMQPLLSTLKRRHLVEVTSGSHNQATYQYLITEEGANRTRELLDRNGYVGPAPVSLEHYISVIHRQTQNRPPVHEKDVRHAVEEMGLVISADIVDRIGPAVNSFRSMFLYGPSGNGKTTIAKAITNYLLPGHFLVPHAIYAHGQIIKVFDEETHRAKNSHFFSKQLNITPDERWVECQPPVVIAGGELTLSDLDLAWSSNNGFYEAPLQLKANGGLFLIDDFGRQQVPPHDLLNRWIVPLEERLDFFTFHTGKKFAVPFEELLIFSTNLDPTELVDEAFLRRIRHKLGIDNPTQKQFYHIFASACQQRQLEFNREAFVALLKKHYTEANRELKACHPRDLLDQLADFAHYRNHPPEMTVEALDEAAASYFVEFF